MKVLRKPRLEFQGRGMSKSYKFCEKGFDKEFAKKVLPKAEFLFRQTDCRTQALAESRTDRKSSDARYFSTTLCRGKLRIEVHQGNDRRLQCLRTNDFLLCGLEEIDRKTRSHQFAQGDVACSGKNGSIKCPSKQGFAGIDGIPGRQTG